MSDQGVIKMEQIAIIGMGCRFPKSSNPTNYWELLANGVDAITAAPENRSGFADIAPELRYGGFIESHESFDANFFGISHREAKRMDPQQRILLEVVWESLENAGIKPNKIAGSSTGVFIGVMGSDWGRISLSDSEKIDIYTGTGNGYCMIANRISYFYNLHGPSIAIDTACSSSLVAVDQACKYLINNEIDTAIVGGVNLILTPILNIFYEKAGLSSKDGKSKPFGENANGIVRGEGAGIIILKRLSEAINDGDRIYAVIKSSAVNHNGMANGITAPSRWAQIEVMKSAIKKASIDPKDVQYIEAHGTGTAMGDPIEAKGLGEVYGKNRKSPCLIGSVKSNIGHLEGAAGIAAIIKVILSLYYKKIPPSLHFKSGNAHINFKKLNLSVATSLIDWPTRQRIAGISSFGLGGANAHVLLEGYDAVNSSKDLNIKKSTYFLKLSGKTSNSIKNLATSYLNLNLNDNALPMICSIANIKRSDFAFRKAFIGSTCAELKKNIQSWLKTDRCIHIENVPNIAFVFTGKFEQNINNIKTLYNEFSCFKEICDEAVKAASKYLKIDLIDSEYFLFNQKHKNKLRAFLVEYCIGKYLIAIGIIPKVIVGFGIGNYVALAISNVKHFNDIVKLFNKKLNDARAVKIEKETSIPLLLLNNKVSAKMKAVNDKLLNTYNITDFMFITNIHKQNVLENISSVINDNTVTLFPEISSSVKDFYQIVADLYTSGINIHWQNLCSDHVANDIPTYPFSRDIIGIQLSADQSNKEKKLLSIETTKLVKMFTPSRNEISKIVVDSIIKTIDHDVVSINEKSSLQYELGFDSLMMVELQDKLAKHLNLKEKLLFNNIFDTKTVEDIINHLEKLIN